MDQINALKSHLINKRYKLEPYKMDSGTYGTVYLGTDTLTKKKVAIKVENPDTPQPTIQHEIALYQKIIDCHGFPNMLFGGQEKGVNVLVMELLGVSLKHVFEELGNKFSLKTVLQIADQMLMRLQILHTLDFVHCDLKPANIMTGSSHISGTVYLIDFGLARQYVHEDVHFPINPDVPRFIGSPMFASCNAHMYRTLSRRDDLESLGYVLIYFATGTLPWETFSTNTLAEQFLYMQRVKLATSIEELCEGVPPEFMQYFQYVRRLEYEEEPDYHYLRVMFRAISEKYKYNYDCVFEWNQQYFPNA